MIKTRGRVILIKYNDEPILNYICQITPSKMNIEFNRNEDAMKMLLSDMRQAFGKNI